MYKKLLIILLLIPIVYASEEADWILEQSTDGIWSNTEQTSLAILALSTESQYRSDIQTALSSLESNLESCIDDNSCNVKNTALSLLALKKAKPSSSILSEASTWLLNSRSIQFTGETQGWLIQVISSSPGICTLTNTETEAQQPISVSSGYTPWVEVSPSVLDINTQSLLLECPTLSSTPTLSLLQRRNQQISGSTATVYYIKQESPSKSIEVEFGNPCWGNSYQSTCNKETTAFALYTLKELDKTSDPTWLEEQSLTSLETALLYKATNKQEYLELLEEQQTSSGYWGAQDVESTSWIYSLIKPSEILSRTSQWIESRKDATDTCWPKFNCDLSTTALVVYSGSFNPSSSSVSNPPNGTTISNTTTTPTGTTGTGSEGTTCTTAQACPGTFNFDGECSDIRYDGCPAPDVTPDLGGEECTEGESCLTTPGCAGICDFFGECKDTPGDECPAETVVTDDEDEGLGALMWSLIIIVILGIFGGGGYYAYSQGYLDKIFKKKPGPKPKSYQPILKTEPKHYRPPMRKRKKPNFINHMENQLDGSMKELEDLLKIK